MKFHSEILSYTRKSFPLTNTSLLRRHIDQRQHFFMAKRIVDIVFSIGAILFIGSWLFPLIAVLIKLDSRGPVFFIQKRVGRGGRTFRCLKFRTMIVNNEANQRQASENDARITRVGMLLRKSNLDELPQFLNVLNGDMSIVGPRPHMHADCNKFSNVISGYKFRNLVKPGITGLAQVKGYRGPTNDFESIFRRYQYDSYYIRNASIWLDMRIVRHTAAQTTFFIWNKIKGQQQIRPVIRKITSAIKSFLY